MLSGRERLEKERECKLLKKASVLTCEGSDEHSEATAGERFSHEDLQKFQEPARAIVESAKLVYDSTCHTGKNCSKWSLGCKFGYKVWKNGICDTASLAIDDKLLLDERSGGFD